MSSRTEVIAGPSEAGRSERAMLATVALATMLAPLNSTMIAVALPRILDELGIAVSAGGWLITAYLLAMAALQPVAGKLGDRLGRRRLVLGGLMYFGATSLGAALAPSFPLLLLFRVQQAVAGALIVPNGTALIRELVPAERRGSSSGLVGSAVALAAAAGPPVGGVLVAAAGWRAIFFVNLALVIPALALGVVAIPPAEARLKERAGTFDVPGALGLTIVLLGVAGILTQGHRLSQLALLGAVAALVAVAAAFFRRELRHPDPVLQPRFFQSRSFAAANATIGLSNLAMYSTLVAAPFLLERRPGWTSLKVGLVLALLSAAMVVFAPVGGRLADRWGRRWPTVLGLVLLVVGFAPLLAGEAVTTPSLLAGLTVAGIGLGLATAGLQTAGIEAVGKRYAGAAAGVFSTSRYLGSIVGTSLLAGLVGTTAGFSLVFLMVAVAAVFSVLTSLGLADHPPAD